MKRPERHQFMVETKVDGKVYKTFNAEAYNHAIRKWEGTQKNHKIRKFSYE